MTRHTKGRDWDEVDDDEEGYDDSEGYSDDTDEDEDYQEFLEREFGSGAGGSHLSPLQYATVFVLLAIFIIPPLLYLFSSLAQ